MKLHRFLFLALIFFFIVCSLAHAADWLPDVHLERAVREELEIPDEIPIHPGDMAGLHNLIVIEIEHGIRSLKGLEHAVNLKVLVVDRSEVSDLTPLAGLENLESLSIVRSEVSDLAPLAGLENLRVLKLYDNHRISDITPLTGLVNLEVLQLHDNKISDLAPLTGLVNLEVLQLHYNQISDITPIRSLTKLERLTIIGNPIDYTQLGNLPAELRQCRVDASGYEAPIAERIQNRDYPSIGVRDYILATRDQRTMEIVTRFDLVFGALPFTPLREWTTRWLTAWGLPPVLKNLSTRVGHIDEMIEIHTEVLQRNPNMILLIGLDFQNGLFERYGEDWEGWLRDKEGNRLTSRWRTYTGEEEWDNLIDFTKPVVIEQIVQQAKAISECGLYDGIWLDHWGEGKRLQGVYTAEEEYIAKDTILQRIREVVPDDFFILVNNNRRKLQPRWAPYVNGIYMESGRDFLETKPDGPDGYTFAGIRDIEEALLWNETKLRKPTLNLLEGEVSYVKPIDSPDVKQIVRFFTTMTLTHSNASVFMLHYDEFYWYRFYDAPLGRPVGGNETKGVLYETPKGVSIDGMFIREFTNGWAVYNRSGTTQEIELPQEVSGWSSGVENQRRHTLPDLDGEIYLKTVVQVAPGEYPPLYWINAKTDTLQRLVDTEVKNLISGVQNATSLTVDAAGGKLYWTEQTSQRTGKIQSANLDGTNVQLVRALTSRPLNIALDIANGKLYLSNAWGKIQRMNLDGANFQANLITGLTDPQNLVLDTTSGQLYWTEQTGKTTGKIQRANLDGSNVQLVKALTSAPRGMTLDAVNRKLYLTNGWGKLQRMNLNGSNFESNFITGLASPGQVVVDRVGGKLYWTEQGVLRRADLNGENIEDVITGLGELADLGLGVDSAGEIGVAAAPAITTVVEQTQLLPNYPNPFNPETWIPYHLANLSEVTITIYDMRGTIVRQLNLGHQHEGYYTGRSRAAYWDGRNTVGERVASGVYFYQLQADGLSYSRRMVIVK